MTAPRCTVRLCVPRNWPMMQMKITDLPNAQAVFVHEDPEELGAAVAQRVAELAAQAIASRGAFHIGLAGGETPRRCYEKLRHLPVDWEHVQVYFGDERCLPAGDARRNDAMARETLLGHVAIPSDNIHVIPAELGAREAAARYAAMLDRKSTRLNSSHQKNLVC